MISDSELELDMHDASGALRLRTADEVFQLVPDEGGSEPSAKEIADHEAMLERYKDTRWLYALARYKTHTVAVVLPLPIKAINEAAMFEKFIKPQIISRAKQTLRDNGIT